MVIFATKACEYLAVSFAASVGGQFGMLERRTFPNGERYCRIVEPAPAALVNMDAVIIASIISDEDLLEIQRLASTLADLGTRKRVFIVPYLAYSTMEVAKLPGEVVTAKTNARLLSHLPKAADNTFVFLDLHEPSLSHYFEGDITVMETSAIGLLAQAIKRLHLSRPLVGSADLGMPVQIQELASLLKADTALVSKSRQFQHTAVLAAVGDVADRTVVIYDDMVRSGSSLMQAARAYKKAGAKKIYAAVSHLALSSDKVLTKFKKSPIEHLITTNSHPASQRGIVRRSKFVTVLDIVPAVAKPLKKLIL